MLVNQKGLIYFQLLGIVISISCLTAKSILVSLVPFGLLIVLSICAYVYSVQLDALYLEALDDNH